MVFNPDWQHLFSSMRGFFQTQALSIIFTIAIMIVVSRIVITIANKAAQKDETRHAIRKWTRYITIAGSILWVTVLYYSYRHEETPFLFLILGFVLAGIAFSLREVLSSAVGWLIVISSKGFRQGDRVAINGLCGDVLDIGIFRTVIAEIGEWIDADQSTGRIVSMPNSAIISNNVYNYSQGFEFIWDEIPILVTFESDWQAAERIMEEVAREDFLQKRDQIQERLKRVRRRFLLRLNYISPKVYVRVADSGVLLSLRYLVKPRSRRTVADALSRKILLGFSQEAHIDFAYPTIRYYSPGPSDGTIASPDHVSGV